MEELLERLENFLEGKNEREKVILALMPIFIFGAISYLHLFPLAENYLKKTQNEKSALTLKINQNIAYLNSVHADKGEQAIIAKYKEVVFAIRDKVEVVNSNIDYIKFKINEFTKEQNKWSSFLDFIAYASNKNSLNIDYINSEKFPYKDAKLFKNSHIEVKGEGEFKDILNYINDIETYGVFVDVENVKLHYNSEKQKLIFKLNIYNWEIKT